LAVAAAVGLTASSCWFGFEYMHAQQQAAAQQAAAHQVEIANATLQDALARMRDQLAAADHELHSAQSREAAASGEAQRQRAASQRVTTTDSDRIAQLTRELHMTEAQRVTLMARLSLTQASMAQGKARQSQTQAGIDSSQKKLQELAQDRDRAARERDRLQAELGALQQQLAAVQSTQSRATVPAARAPAPAAVPRSAAAGPAVAAAPAPAAPARTAAPQVVATPRPVAPVAAVVPAQAIRPAAPAPVAAAPAAAAATTLAAGRIGQFERVLASAGVDVRSLFARFGVSDEPRGGPFVPVPRGGVSTMSAAQIAALGRIVGELPVSAPLTAYRVSSPFGVRGDPLNGDSGFHTGIDMVAPYMSPVYATAPGVVTYAGFREDYGRVVEINHGNGIASRYAHLHRALVSVGQRVAAHQEIGLLGSSGRATGPHVHYEVLVNGEPQDPEKFLGLARLVPVTMASGR
jgi:murein DD-endopeptidase MepM/ murein hydrolase activator NlpD